MRQYALRSSGEVGDLQVTLQDKALRAEQSHSIVKRLRPGLQAIGRRLSGQRQTGPRYSPAPPVLSPLVAEIYRPEAQGPPAGGTCRARGARSHARGGGRG